MMKRMGTKLLVVLAMGIGGLVAVQQPTTAHAAKTFSSLPSGNLQSAKAQYAFRYQKVSSKGKTGEILVLGDFKNASVRYAIPYKLKLSKDHRTLSTYYHLMSLKGKLGKSTYKMSVYRYSTTKYRVKLNNYKAGRMPSYKGSSYTFTATKSSPASKYASKYTKPAVTKTYTAQLTKALADQYSSGKSSLDPNSAEVKAQISKSVGSTVDKTITALLNAYKIK